jgi:hypothetical protein
MKFANFMFASYLEENERLLAVCHRHLFILLPQLLRLTLVGIALPILFYFLFPDFLILFIIWIGINLTRMFRATLIWYHDAILITDMSLIDVYWFSMFNKSSSRVEYQMIEGVSQEIKGFLRTIFNYGDISIQVMSGGSAMALKDAVNPRRIERMVLDYQKKYTMEQSFRDAESLKTILVQMVRQQVKNKE